MFIDFREMEGERKKKTIGVGEQQISCLPQAPDQESNPQPCGVWVDAPTRWAVQPWLELFPDNEGC